jgi:hypothetical protein
MAAPGLQTDANGGLPSVTQVPLAWHVLNALQAAPFALKVGFTHCPEPLQVVPVVQSLKSSQAVPEATFVPPVHDPLPLHFSPVVQVLWSSHGVLADTFTTPWLQFAPAPLHCSPCVHGLPSLQGVPDDRFCVMQFPSLVRQLAVWHELVGCAHTFATELQVPLPLHVSIVHGLLSRLHVVPAASSAPVQVWSVRPVPVVTHA